ncbi:MAG: hypothetical protein JNK64_24970 [Myxococcales bacterium]|nr:hypothetical protein [Myxococcales bacterium]
MNKWLRASAVLTLVALAMMVWSVLRPTPLPVMLAMSLGQAVGTAAFGIYGWVVLADLRRIRRDAKRAQELGLAEAAVEAPAAEAAVEAPAAEAAATKPPEPGS